MTDHRQGHDEAHDQQPHSRSEAASEPPDVDRADVDRADDQDPDGRDPDGRDLTGLREHRHPRKLVLGIALAPILLVAIVGTTINFLFRPYLTTHHPLAMLIVNPQILWMLLVQGHVDSFSYYTAVIARRLFADPSYFFLGYWYGAAGIRWVYRQSPELGRIAAKVEEWFPKFGWLLVLVYPHQLVMAMAGASTMRLRTFLLLDALGTVALAVGVREFGHYFDWATNPTNSFLDKYWIPLMIASAVLLIITMAGRKPEDRGFKSIGGIEAELEAETQRDRDESAKQKPRKPE